MQIFFLFTSKGSKATFRGGFFSLKDYLTSFMVGGLHNSITVANLAVWLHARHGL
jgi:hypothetical protein